MSAAIRITLKSACRLLGLCVALSAHAQVQPPPVDQDMKFVVPIDLTHPAGVEAHLMCSLKTGNSYLSNIVQKVPLSSPQGANVSTVRDTPTMELTFRVPGSQVLYVVGWECQMIRTDGWTKDGQAWRDVFERYRFPPLDRLLAKQTGSLAAR